MNQTELIKELEGLGIYASSILVKQGHSHISPLIDIQGYYNPKEKIMNQTLRTQADAISAIRSNVYLIGSVAANGDFSMSTSPSVHNTTDSARAECKRLASANPGKLFHFFRLGGAELVPTATVSI
jgi:hypothetical protein